MADTVELTEFGKQLLARFDHGCKCSTPCGLGPPKSGECVYWIAKTRGPINMKECTCIPKGAKSYHDKNGICLRCEGKGA